MGQETAPPENKPQNKLPQTAETKPVQAGRFKVGDRVLASTMALDGDKYFEKCTVIKDYMKTEGRHTYRVRCDSPDGGIGTRSKCQSTVYSRLGERRASARNARLSV